MNKNKAKHFIHQWTKHARHLEDLGVYRSTDEHDACGVGMVASITGEPKHEVVHYALDALKAIWHRGAVDADGKTGDGAGILLDIPQAFFKAHVKDTGHVPKEDDLVGLGMMFLPRNDIGEQEACRSIVEAELIKGGFQIFGWRQVPVNPKVLGEKANVTRPEIEQIMILIKPERDFQVVDRSLYRIRRRIEKLVEDRSINDFYICSLSSRLLVYKGLFLSQDIDQFYPDLSDDQFISRFAIYHQRYSTNTFPSWALAQPFRVLAHNGEINTIQGNKNWTEVFETGMKSDDFGEGGISDILPIIPHGTSDSGALDSMFELLVQAKYSLPFVKSILIPEAWRSKKDIKDKQRHFYAFCNSIMEPWDGPAAVCAAFGDWLICGMDRSGLRPLRYSILKDGLFIGGSESGMVQIDESRIFQKDSLDPGKIIAINLKEGKFYTHQEIIDQLTCDYQDLVSNYYHSVINLDKQFTNLKEKSVFDDQKRICYQKVYQLSNEDLELILRPMILDAKEAIGSMGDDTPLAVLSNNYRPLHHFLRQDFSQVTNPPLDPLRESNVMTLSTRFKTSENVLSCEKKGVPLYLESPVLMNAQFAVLSKHLDQVETIDCLFDPQKGKYSLKSALNQIQTQAAEAAKNRRHIILTDANQTNQFAPIPMILATSAVHRYLIDQKLRHRISLNVRSGECLDSHYFAVLLGVGATSINPYLTQEAIFHFIDKNQHIDLTFEQALNNYKKAINQGLLKIISKMGISVLSSYRNACNFESIGLSRALVREYFPGMPARISGIGLYGIQAHMSRAHQAAWNAKNHNLSIGGFYNFRFNQGEAHVWSPEVIQDLQQATRENSYTLYKRYAVQLNNKASPIHLRDLLDFKSKEHKDLEIEQVESMEAIRSRFVTPGMSLGALSKEAHGALNIAMNRIGAKSVSGEGGEDPKRYTLLPNGDNPNSFVKQVASGRFGVTAQYLNQCGEIEIKIAQGAKPGEGGQLPGFKVSVEIAKLRHSTPGVTLISPPPHHDIYSIEDLAQLIYDLKQINPVARVCVKLTARSGIGTIASGVAKANADIISISGYNGGTGAGPQTSIKFAGIPWEMGLSEVHQVLTMNRLRSQVTLRTDGSLMTGRDVLIAAMLGAEEYGIGTASLVAMGCLMVRQCHSNTCPVGVCTQDEKLRGYFKGTPEKVIHLMTFIAMEIRELLAGLGYHSLEQVIGRSDLLAQVSRGASNLDDLDMNPILSRVEIDDSPAFSDRKTRNAVPDTLDAKIIEDAHVFFKDQTPIELSYQILNTNRTVGARFASEIVRRLSNVRLSENQVVLRFKGSAGQSFGAFAVFGMRLEIEGDANDYVGKGLSGAIIVIKPSRLATFKAHENVIIGNTVLFGATSGKLFASGIAGERFCVRNSGAIAVVEGCGANGCEYMTSGKAVILGKVGENFAAGMTGGMAYVFDPKDCLFHYCNQETVSLNRVLNPYYADELKSMLSAHFSATGSVQTKMILENWEDCLGHFWHVVPKELIDKLKVPLFVHSE